MSEDLVMGVVSDPGPILTRREELMAMIERRKQQVAELEAELAAYMDGEPVHRIADALTPFYGRSDQRLVDRQAVAQTAWKAYPDERFWLVFLRELARAIAV